MLDESTVQEYSEYIGAFIVQCKSEDITSTIRYYKRRCSSIHWIKI